MSDDSSIMQVFQDAQARSSKGGVVPVLVAVDEPLWECPIINSNKDSEVSEGYAFDAASVAQYRKEALAPPIKDGKVVLDGCCMSAGRRLGTTGQIGIQRFLERWLGMKPMKVSLAAGIFPSIKLFRYS